MEQKEELLIPKIDPIKNDIPTLPKSKYVIFLKWFGLFIAVFALYITIVGLLLFTSSKKLLTSVNNAIQISKSGDIKTAKSELPKIKKALSLVKTNYQFISFMKYTPVVGGYVEDLGRIIKSAEAGLTALDIVATATMPYIEILGFTPGETSSSEKTTQERIDFVIGALPEILPKINELSNQVYIIQKEVSKIDPERYPKNYMNIDLRSRIYEIQKVIDQTATFIVKGKPVLENAQYLLGMDSPRTYLVLFQNDKELRPTGGFMTAYSIMKVDKAKFEPVVSDDIYNLDAKYKPSIPAPEPLVKYIKGPYILSKNLRLRDMNWSPDFIQSMELFSEAIKETGIDDIDGILAVDTHLLVNLLNVIGPIGVPEFGNFTTEIDPECNCPQVIHELESFADIEGPIIWDPLTGKIIQRPPNSDNRKKIIGPLMNSILANALGLPKEKLPNLLEAAMTSVIEKHVLFYLYDDNIQKALSDFGISGTINNYDGDYLHVNDANLGGRKSNLYVSQEVSQEILVENGEIIKTLTLTYKNPEKHDGWLNSVLPNWVRVYVPKGSELIAAEGLEDKAPIYDDFDKTVFSGLFQLRPEGVSKVTFKYKLPFKVGNEYKLLIQKQPGTDGNLHTISLGKFEEEFLLKTDREIKLKI